MLDAYDGSVLVKACARLGAMDREPARHDAHVALDLDAGLWTIGKGRDGMKRGYYHLTPLPTQVVAMLRDLKKTSGVWPLPSCFWHRTRLFAG